MRDIRVVERSRRLLQPWELTALAGSRSFSELVRRKILAVRLGPAGSWEAEAGAFCGSVSVDEQTTLTISELVPGTVDALFAMAEPTAVRFLQHRSEVRRSDEPPDVSPVASRLWGMFLDVAEEYLAMGSGADKEYTSSIEISGRPRGKLMMRPTIRQLLTHGVRDRLVCRPISLSVDTERNRLVRLALETITAAAGRSALATRAELLMFYLRGVALDRELAFRVRAGLPLRCDAVSARAALDELAISVIRGIRLFSDDGERIDVPFAAFVRLHELFERAVFEAVSSWCSRHPGATARRKRGAVGARPIFADTGTIEAEPDVVVSFDERDELLIDAKYSVFSDELRHGNVYQLIAHCGAYSATEGWLVGVADDRTPPARYLGATEAGVVIRTLAVDPRSVRSAVSDALDTWFMQRMRGISSAVSNALSS